MPWTSGLFTIPALDRPEFAEFMNMTTGEAPKRRQPDAFAVQAAH
jgi:hypothetical protein